MGLEDTPPGDLAPGTTFGSYEIVRKIGAGGMGAVYEARRHDLNKRVALKVLTVADHPGAAARFIREARISASLDHPHVADCLDVGECEGVPYLALEYLEGETLGARLRRGAMTTQEIVDVLLPVCSALAVAHARDLVHRDLKPENIFLARKAGALVPKVLDFGIAKAATADGAGLTHTAVIMGTPGYMSPEQAKDSKHVTAASDQFSLGVILWEAVTGRLLFVGESTIEVLFKVVHEETQPLSSALPSAPEALERIVATLLQKNAARRFASMREIGAALLPLASDAGRARWTEEFAARSSVTSELAYMKTGFHASTPPPAPGTSPAPTTLTRASTTRDVTPGASKPSSRITPAVGVIAAVALIAAGAWVVTHRGARGTEAAAAPRPATAPAPVTAIAPATPPAPRPPETTSASVQPLDTGPAIPAANARVSPGSRARRGGGGSETQPSPRVRRRRID